MKILIDANIILDVLADRKPFVEDAKKIFKLCEVKKLCGCVSALTVSNIVYIMRKELDGAKIKAIIDKLSFMFEIVDLKSEDLKLAAAMDFGDYEDAVQSSQARRIKADYIVTRNVKDFRNSVVKAVTPGEILSSVV